jgi:amidase
MSVFTFEAREGNPIIAQDIIALGKDLHVAEKPEDLDQYAKLLAVYHDACEEIMAMDDYIPTTNLGRFPRENVYKPEGEENNWNAWGYKVEIKDEESRDNNEGLLKGFTAVLKDCIGIAKVPMLLGTDFITNFVPEADATVVTRLLEAGATIKGKAICENLCHSATSHSAATGPIDNPLAPGYSTGGSSSGCAALVADKSLGIDIAIGADQGGSVRIPAGWSGIVGIKPTFGLIPFTGCASNEATNDHLGVMTRDVLTNALALQAIAGTDWIDDRAYNSITTPYYDDLLKEDGSLHGMKIAILEEGFDNPAVEERIKECCMAAIKKLEDLGAEVKVVSIPMHSKGPLIWTGISKLGNYTNKLAQANSRRGYSMNDLNAEFVKAMHSQESWEKLYPSSKNTFYNGAYAVKKFPLLYGKCMNLSRKLKDDYNKCFDEYDVIVMPNLPYIATPHTYITTETKPLDLLSNQKGLSSNTAPFDQSGHPALSLPCGMLPITNGPLANSGEKLPVSLQLVAKWFDEKTLYKVAYAFEKNFDWKNL